MCLASVFFVVTKEQVIEVLKTCIDPELHVDLWTLELIYEIQVTGNSVYVKMTLTTPACPYGPEVIDTVKKKIAQMEGVESVFVDVTFMPPWQPTQELRDLLMSGSL